jgi:hypothetical protein
MKQQSSSSPVNHPQWTSSPSVSSDYYVGQQSTAMYHHQQVATTKTDHTTTTTTATSPLKRKPQSNDTSRPSKQPYVYQQPSPTPSGTTTTLYHTPVSSPLFAANTNGVNQMQQQQQQHLSPYGYDQQQQPPQWTKRPPSRSEMIRMELRHSVQARQQAVSPQSGTFVIYACYIICV